MQNMPLLNGIITWRRNSEDFPRGNPLIFLGIFLLTPSGLWMAVDFSRVGTPTISAFLP